VNKRKIFVNYYIYNVIKNNKSKTLIYKIINSIVIIIILIIVYKFYLFIIFL